MTRKVILGVIILLSLSGCAEGNTYWEVGIGAETKTMDSRVAVDGEVGLSGNYGPVEVENVRIVFLYDNKSIIKAIGIGTLNGSHNVESFNITMSPVPDYIILQTGEISSPDNMEYHIFPGLKRTTEGDYVELNRRITPNDAT